MDKKDEVVVRCPLLGHGPLCTRGECAEAAKDNYQTCREDLGLVPRDRKKGSKFQPKLDFSSEL